MGSLFNLLVYSYQKEIKAVAELMSTNEIKIPAIKRIEIHINNSTKLERFNIKKYWFARNGYLTFWIIRFVPSIDDS